MMIYVLCTLKLQSQLMSAKLELKEIKACSLLLGACTSCLMLKSNLEACSIEIKNLKQRLDHSSCYKFFHPLVMFVVLLRVSFSMLPRRTLSQNKKLLICLHVLRKPNRVRK
jgi:hypothetical protein